MIRELANMAKNSEPKRLLLQNATYLKDQVKKYNKESSIVKLFASKIAMDATIECAQIYGTCGYIQD